MTEQIDFPVDDIGNGIISRIAAARASFTPALKLAELDQFWNRPTNLADLAGRCPLVVAQLDTANFSWEGGHCVQPYPWLLNYLYPLKSTNRIDPLKAMRILAKLFTAGESLDEISELVTAVGSGHLDDCQVKGMSLSSALEDYNVGWGLVPILVTVVA